LIGGRNYAASAAAADCDCIGAYVKQKSRGSQNTTTTTAAAAAKGDYAAAARACGNKIIHTGGNTLAKHAPTTGGSSGACGENGH